MADDYLNVAALVMSYSAEFEKAQKARADLDVLLRYRKPVEDYNQGQFVRDVTWHKTIYALDDEGLLKCVRQAGVLRSAAQQMVVPKGKVHPLFGKFVNLDLLPQLGDFLMLHYAHGACEMSVFTPEAMGKKPSAAA